MKKVLKSLVVLVCAASFVAVAKVENQASTAELSARLGAEMASKLFDKVPAIVKVLPQQKEQNLKQVKAAVEKVSQAFADTAKREQLEKFFEELGKFENPDEATVKALFEKYPVAQEIQTDGVVEGFITGVAMVLADRCGISNEEALMVARVVFTLFLPK